MEIKKFIRGYIACALWSSELDGYTMDDLSEKTLVKMTKDCNDFADEAKLLLKNIDYRQAGHDFWLTRNCHGAGFWDRNLGEIGHELTVLSNKYGELSLYVGDDNLIYCE